MSASLATLSSACISYPQCSTLGVNLFRPGGSPVSRLQLRSTLLFSAQLKNLRQTLPNRTSIAGKINAFGDEVFFEKNTDLESFSSIAVEDTVLEKQPGEKPLDLPTESIDTPGGNISVAQTEVSGETIIETPEETSILSSESFPAQATEEPLQSSAISEAATEEPLQSSAISEAATEPDPTQPPEPAIGSTEDIVKQQQENELLLSVPPEATEAPQEPQIQSDSPDLSIPDTVESELKLPDLSPPELPEFSPPELPEFSPPKLPEFSPPELPEFSPPELPEFSSPELPQLEFSTPTPDVPEPSIPPVPEPAEVVKSAAERYRELLESSSPSSSSAGENSSGGFPAPPNIFDSEDPIAAVQDFFAGLSGSIQETVQNANSSVGSALKDAQSSVDSFLQSLTASSQGLQEQISNPKLPELPKLPGNFLPEAPKLPAVNFEVPLLPPIPESLKSGFGKVVGSGEEALEGALAYLVQQTAAAYSQFKGQLPPEVVQQLEAAEAKASDVIGPAVATGKEAAVQAWVASGAILRALEASAGLNPDDPQVQTTLTAFALLAALVFFSISYWRAYWAGYSGDLSPEDSLKLLREEFDALLVDIRPPETREKDGIPDLRRNARFKDAYVEFEKLVGPVRKLVKNSEELELQLMAAKITGLKGVGVNTRVVVMDDSGSSLAKQIARGLKKYGRVQRAYRMVGGYQLWAQSLRTKEDKEESAVTILKKEAEAFVEEVRPTTEGVAAVLAGSVLAVYAVSEWEKTLQLIGLIGLSASAYSRISSYESEEDLKNDLKMLLRPFALATAAAIWVGNLIDGSASGKPQLAGISDGSLINEEVEEYEEEEENEEEEKGVAEEVQQSNSSTAVE